MHARKSNRRYVVIMAASVSLLMVLGPQSAMAQFMPGLPGTAPIWTPPPPRAIAPQTEQTTMMYTDMKVTSKMHTVAESQVFSSKLQYEMAAKLLETRIAVLSALDLHDTLEMAATLNNLGWMQEHIGQLRAAEQAYRQAIKILQPRYGRYPAELAVVKYNLADLYMSEHNALGAMHYFREAMQNLNAAPNPDRQAATQIQRKYDVVRKLILADSGPTLH